LTVPIEKLLDGLELKSLPEPAEKLDGLYAIREGELEIGAARLRVYQLNDGQRVFDAESVAAFLTPPSIPDERAEA
jgi:hypothetical protein